ncbi:hypothetical protein J2S59_002670 [Nocardioides massiliensis]|uniref:Uncharacterized protein n=1 Tax=Nocardioides massiliensis TaxID=1325935 RepID=A0ABT9NR02_9ACTN|nr:hypothetical protein [Nocardioides massiliensis]MDP9822861.1 hypothetical protein [Nocardioides massiliensis]
MSGAEGTPAGPLPDHSSAAPPRNRIRRWMVAIVAVLVLALAGAGAFVLLREDADPYCETVRASNDELAVLVGDSGDSAVETFNDSLDVLERLAAEAPSEISADWNTLILRLRGLRDALVAAGVDLSGDEVDLTALEDASEEEVAAVTTAATELGSTDANRASRAIEDHARQSCDVALGATDDEGDDEGDGAGDGATRD